jgi:hypothetical protein
MADPEVRENDNSQRSGCQTSVESVKYCESCVILENQLYNTQEELKNSKVIINLLLKDIETKETNLKSVPETREQKIESVSTWSEVVKGVKKPDTSRRQIEANPIEVIINQCKTQKRLVNQKVPVIDYSHERGNEIEVNLPNYASNTLELKQYASNGDANEWKEVPRKKRSIDVTKKDSNKLKHHTVHTIPSKNRFLPLSDYQDVALQRKIKMKPLLVSKGGDRKIHKVVILGDSHVRGCSEKLANTLGNGFTVMGISKPNANMSAIIDYRYLKTEKLSKNDAVIICGGTRDVARNETKEGLKKMSELVRFLSNTNVIVTCVPHRFDLQADSCVNKEVELFNRKLQKQMKAFDHVKICNLSDNREHFTTHGFHMNAKGKFGITNKWASFIHSIFARNQPLPVTPLPWIKVKDSGLAEYAKSKDSMMNGSELLEEDETVECTVLKLRNASDQNPSLSNVGVDLSAPEIEMLDEDNGEKTDQNELIGSSSSVTDERDKCLEVDKDNFRYCEPEETSNSVGGVDNDRMNVYDEGNMEVGSLTELTKPLEIGEKGNGRSRYIEGLIVSELDNTRDNRIRRKPVTRSSDFLWEDWSMNQI